MKKTIILISCFALCSSELIAEQSARDIVVSSITNALEGKGLTPNGFSKDVLTLGYEAFPTLCDMLSENMDDQRYRDIITEHFLWVDGYNYASYGDRRALELTRKALRKGASHWAFRYLMFKGNVDDVGLAQYVQMDAMTSNTLDRAHFPLRSAVEYLQERRTESFFGTSGFLPSVTNTGPQAMYALAILRRAATQSEADGGWRSDIPEELQTMVVTFDANGNPVCNVDLAKYGLSMPVITPKPDPNDPVGWNPWLCDELQLEIERSIVFPHDALNVEFPSTNAMEATGLPTGAPPSDVQEAPDETPSSEQHEEPPRSKNSLWLLVTVLAVLVVGGGTWKVAHHTKHK